MNPSHWMALWYVSCIRTPTMVLHTTPESLTDRSTNKWEKNSYFFIIYYRQFWKRDICQLTKTLFYICTSDQWATRTIYLILHIYFFMTDTWWWFPTLCRGFGYQVFVITQMIKTWFVLLSILSYLNKFGKDTVTHTASFKVIVKSNPYFSPAVSEHCSHQKDKQHLS